MPTQATRYSPLAQIFHWVIAGLIVVQFTLARLAEPLPLGVHKLALLARHKSVGMTILDARGAAARCGVFGIPPRRCPRA